MKRTWALLFGVGALVVAWAHLFGSDLAVRLSQQGIGFLSTAAAIAGVVASRGRPRAGWLLVAGSLVCFSAGDVVVQYYVLVRHEAYVPVGTLADVFYVGGYVPLALGILRVGRDASTRHSRVELLDATILVVGWGWIAWHLFVAPSLGAPGLSTAAHVITAAKPGLDLLLLGGLATVLMDHRRLTVPGILLVTGTIGTLLSDLAVAIVVRFGLGWPGWLNVGWLVAFATIGAATLMAEGAPIARRRDEAASAFGVVRLTLIATALLAIPALGQLSQEIRLTRDSLAVAVLLVGLVLARIRLTAGAEARARAVADASDRFQRALLAHAPGDVLVLDEAGRLRYDARDAGRPARMTEATTWLTLVHPEDRDAARGAWQEALDGTAADGTASVELRVDTQGGSWAWYDVHLTNLLAEAHVRGVVANLRDVTERKEYEARLVELALHDALTGLPNRTLVGDRIEHALARTRRTGRHVAVLFCDLDRFKTVNDTLGHAAGDQLLRTFADRLSGCVRDEDTVARLGGDEFAILLDAASSTDEAVAIAERILETARLPVQIGHHSLVVRASIGVAFGDEIATAEELLHNADAAMYEAKKHGSGFALYAPDLHTALTTRRQLEVDLRTALANDEFVVHYQPVFSLGERRITGAEALLRWRHPEHGMVPPGTFIPIAEEAGLLHDIGTWVLRTACRQGALWREQLGADLHISVNVSPTQLVSDDVVDVVRDALVAYGLPASCLVLEITEAVLVTDVDLVIARLRELKQLGLRIAIDDFGTGYSSLSYLRRLPIDVMKVDRSFVSSVAESETDRALVASLLELGRILRLEVVAEGIEDAAQLDWLTSNGCGFGQGYYLARPLAPEAFADLAAWRHVELVPDQRPATETVQLVG